MKFLFAIIPILFATALFAQKEVTNTKVKLHFQVYDKGVCLPMISSPYYSTSKHSKNKQVFQSGSYYTNVIAYIVTKDTSGLHPTADHKNRSCNVTLRKDKKYDLIIIRQEGFDLSTMDSTCIRIDPLEGDAQVSIPLSSNKLKLQKMKHFQLIEKDNEPKFKTESELNFKFELKLDSTAYDQEKAVQTKFYIYAKNYPLYYVEEIYKDGSERKSSGFRLIQNYTNPYTELASKPSIWTNSDVAKHGYWQHYENGNLVKHELWASYKTEGYEWYPSGTLKFKGVFGQYHQKNGYSRYLENGKIQSSYLKESNNHVAQIVDYIYDSSGNLIMENHFNSNNGITRQNLAKRLTYYENGVLKTEELMQNYYSIKRFNQDGTAKR